MLSYNDIKQCLDNKNPVSLEEVLITAKQLADWLEFAILGDGGLCSLCSHDGVDCFDDGGIGPYICDQGIKDAIDWLEQRNK